MTKEFFGPSLLTNQITRSKLLGYKDYLIKRFKGETPSTIWSSFRRVVREAMAEGLIGTDPFIGIQGPPKKRLLVKEILTADELKQMKIHMTDSVVEKSFLWCCLTGMTYPEVCLIRYVDVEDDLIKYTRLKTKKLVSVPMVNATRELLRKEYKSSEKKIFPNLPSDTTARKVIKNWVKRAEIKKDITWYCARHTFGTLLANGGQGSLAISKLMGNTEKIANQYINHVDKLKRDAMNSLPEC